LEDQQLKDSLKQTELTDKLKTTSAQNRANEISGFQGGISRSLTEQIPIENEINDLKDTQKTRLSEINTLTAENLRLLERVAKVQSGLGGGGGGAMSRQTAITGLPSGGGIQQFAVDNRVALLDSLKSYKDFTGELQKINPSGIVEAETQSMTMAMDGFNQFLNQIVAGGITQAFTGLADLIGNALSGASSSLNISSKDILGSFGKILTSLGKMAIALGTTLLIALEGLKSLNPFAVIGAGIALVAVGKIFSNKAKSLGGNALTSGGGGSTASAGVGGGGSQAFSGSRASGGNTGGGGGTFVFEIAGTKLIGVLKNTLDRNKALGGSLLLT